MPLASLVFFVALTLAAIFAPWLTPYDSIELTGRPLAPPSGDHWLGTDEIGRDVLTRVFYGGRISIGVGLGATVLAMGVGVPWGLLSGYARGVVDTASMRLTDAMLAFPSIILAMATVAVLGPSTLNVTIAVGIAQIPRFARLVRAEVLSVREREFVTAAIASGGSDIYIMRRAILPNVMSSIIVQATLTFATAILIEAGLSFIGLGAQPPQPSWGGMLDAARQVTNRQPAYALGAAVPIFLSVLSLSLIGDALRDVLDPDRPGKYRGPVADQTDQSAI